MTKSIRYTEEQLIWLASELSPSVSRNQQVDRAKVIRDFNKAFPGMALTPGKLAGIYTRYGGSQYRFVTEYRGKSIK